MPKAIVIFMGYKYTFKNYDVMCRAVIADQQLTRPYHKTKLAEEVTKVDAQQKLV